MSWGFSNTHRGGTCLLRGDCTYPCSVLRTLIVEARMRFHRHIYGIFTYHKARFKSARDLVQVGVCVIMYNSRRVEMGRGLGHVPVGSPHTYVYNATVTKCTQLVSPGTRICI